MQLLIAAADDLAVLFSRMRPPSKTDPVNARPAAPRKPFQGRWLTSTSWPAFVGIAVQTDRNLHLVTQHFANRPGKADLEHRPAALVENFAVTAFLEAALFEVVG